MAAEQNVALIVQYDGTDYVGWQRQLAPQGISVQQVLEAALTKVYRERIAVAGAGRTDSGVHAAGQCVSFRAHQPVPVDKLARIVNAQLPPDIRVLSARIAADDFHARFSARGKRYRYLLQQGGEDNAFNYRYAWRLPGLLDRAAMEQAAACLLGRHDFAHFTVSGVSASDLHRTVTRLEIAEPEQTQPDFPWQQLTRPLTVTAEADGFLYKMVRIIVGRLVAVGQGRISPDAIAGYLDGTFTRNIPPAPAHGLMMMEVYY